MTHFARLFAALAIAALSVGSASAQATAEQLDQIAKLSAEQFDMQKEVFKEAREWLKSEKHVPSNEKATKADVTKLVEDLYAAGAVRVYFTAVMPEGDVEKAPAAMVIIGGQAAARAKVFETINAFNKTLLTALGKPELVEGLKQADAGQPVVQLQFEY
jgi:uncharacterized protein (DUF2141 family)